jgi:NTE family protein
VQIANIRIEASKGFNPKAVEHDLRVKTGEGFSIAELDNDIALIYGRADFSYLGYSVVTGPDGATLVIDAQSKPWGPGYLKLGLGATTDFTSPTQLNVAAGYRRTWANSLGGEWRVDAQMGYDSFLGTEFLQPLQVRDGAFVAPYAYLERTFAQYYYLDDRLGQYRIHKLGGGVDVGLTSPAGELRLGPYFMDASATPDFGIANFVVPEEESTAVGLRASGIMDWLDSTRFPRSGWFAAADVRAARRDYRSEDQYSRGELALRGVKSFGKNTFSLHLEAGKNFEGELTIYDSFKLGGPMRMSGLFLDQLTGSRYDLATLSYYRQYARLPTEIGRGAYLGFSLETGRIDDPLMKDPWDRMYSGSVFWGADTVIGAIYLGYGHSTLDQGTFYLMIGPTF